MFFDELNNRKSEKEFIDIEQFFDEMELTKTQKENRKELAYNIKDAVLFLFAMLSVGLFNYEFVLEQFRFRYKNEVQKKVRITNELEEYISDITTSIVSTCFSHLDAFQNVTESTEIENNNENSNYFSSEERAVIIAENESLSVMNYNDYQQAIDDGYTKKKWITLKDNKVRKSHKAVDNEVIAIRDYFIVGTSLMLYPHDMNADADQIINCRCSIKYIK